MWLKITHPLFFLNLSLGSFGQHLVLSILQAKLLTVHLVHVSMQIA
jgi:hypothetical protein